MSTTKLDYKVSSPEERKAIVEKILSELEGPPSPSLLENLADYLVLCKDKKDRSILTENRLVTINKRETSYESLVADSEIGEDGVWRITQEPDKNTLLSPKVQITPRDLAQIPELLPLREAIQFWEDKLPRARGREAYTIKKTIISLRKDQYVVKNDRLKPVQTTSIARNSYIPPLREGIVTIDESGAISAEGLTFCNQKAVLSLLLNYESLCIDAEASPQSDLWHLMEDFKELTKRALAPNPIYEHIFKLKTGGYANKEIAESLTSTFGVTHSVEYISSIWRNKIPKVITDQAQEDYLVWYYTNVEKGKWKRCSCCGQIKLAHNKFFSLNKTSKDGFYSICKECRNRRVKEMKKHG